MNALFGLPHSWMDRLHENSNDLEKDSKKRAALRIASGETYPIPLRSLPIVDQRLRLTLIDQIQGNLMLLSTDKMLMPSSARTSPRHLATR